MEVTQEAVTRRGDTLIFDVAQLREKIDQNIEQLLRRIPGITVSTEGQISYQDLPISKFYIEGLDLLEGRYAIATRNLSIDAIRDVEILERHQPIRALDSIIVPPNAAINLRLKSGITFAGTAEGGLGLSPALYDAQGTGFGFTRKQQFNAIGSVNNIGKRRANDYQNFYEDLDFRLPLLSPTLARLPFGLPTEAYLDNQEYTGSLSFLRKVGDQSQFKLNGFVVTDAVDYQGSNIITFRDGNNTAAFSERLSAQRQIDRISGRLLYEINRKRFYLNSTVEVEANRDKTPADNVVNGAFVPEQFGQEDLEIDGNFQAIVRRKQKALQLWGNLNYQEQDVALAVAPLVVSVPELPQLTLDTARQTARRTALTGDVYTSLATRKGLWRLTTDYTLANYPIVLNGRVSRQFYDQATLKLEVEQVFSSAVFRVSPELVRTFSDLADLVQWQDKLGASYYQELPDGWGATRLEYSYQNFRNDNRAATTNLLSLSYERKVFNDNWELHIMARNLLGTETYQWSGIDVFTVSSSSFLLRPRQLFVSLKRSL